MARRPSFVTFTSPWLVFVGLCLVGMLVLLSLAVRDLMGDVPFLQAEVVRGTVLARDDDAARVTYRFTTAQGQVVEASDIVNIDVRKTLEVGDPVDIEYLPGAADRNRVREPWQWVWPIAGVALPLLASLAFGVRFISDLRYVVRERRLWRHGLLADATVTKVTRGTYPRSTTQWRRIRYRFLDRSGLMHEAETPQFPEAEGTPAVGDTAGVRYDPDNPAQSVWVGLEPGERERRLARDEVVIESGEAVCRGTVVAATRQVEDGEAVWLIRYRYRDQHGQVREGKETLPPKKDGSSPHSVDAPVEVIFDPSQPEDAELA